MTMGSRNTVPLRMLRIVPFGLFHILWRPNSLTRASSGVIVAHLMPTLNSWMARAASTVTCRCRCLCALCACDATGPPHLVAGLVPVRQAEVKVLEVHVQVGVDELVLDHGPDHPGHLVAIQLHLRLGRHSACVRAQSPSAQERERTTGLSTLILPVENAARGAVPESPPERAREAQAPPKREAIDRMYSACF